MKNPNHGVHAQHFEEAKALASHLMHLHYCDRDPDEVASLFVPQFSWIGAGEKQYVSGRAAAVESFHQFNGTIPPAFSRTSNTIEPLPGLYTVTGRLWIATAPSVKMYLKVYQRVTLRTEVQNDAVCGDSTRLEQILLNLMSNTVKCTGKGGHITLSAEQKLSSQGGVSCMKFIARGQRHRYNRGIPAQTIPAI